MASAYVLNEHLVPGVSFITYNWNKHIVDLDRESDRQFFVKYKNKVTNIRTRRTDHEINPLKIQWDKIVVLDCIGLRINKLPKPISSCKYLYCHSNELTKLPELPQCRELMNQLVCLICLYVSICFAIKIN
jgi:hypothetical protein